jgi:excisionase family DNA binding protein
MEMSQNSITFEQQEHALSAKALAPLIGCAVHTVYRMAAASQIPFVTVGVGHRGRRFYLSAVRAALESQTSRRHGGNGVGSAA